MTAQVMSKSKSAHVDTVDLATAHREQADSIQYAHDLSRYLVRRNKLRAIQDEHHVQIFVPTSSAILGGNTVIEVVGEPKMVSAAREQVAALVRALPPNSLASVEIDSLLHRHLIGRKGARMRAFEEKKSVEVVFPREGEDRSDVLLVFIGQEAVASAAPGVLEGLYMIIISASHSDLLFVFQRSKLKFSSSPRTLQT